MSSVDPEEMPIGEDVRSKPDEETDILPNGNITSDLDRKENEPTNTELKENVTFKVVYSKQTYEVTFPLDDTVLSLKERIEKITQVPVAMQKLMFRGRMREDVTLRENKVVAGSKILVIGSTMDAILAVSQTASKAPKEGNAPAEVVSKEPLSKQKLHKTVLDKYGVPEDVMPGIRNCHEPLPPFPISGMYNKSGGKVRLTFKLEADQLWIGTKERTEKIGLGMIKSVVDEPIDGHEEYHLMALQLGPTEASKYWIYWVPSQYVNAIKDAILG